MDAIATTLDEPVVTDDGAGGSPAPERPRHPASWWIRRGGYAVLAVQFVGLAVWSQVLCSRFALGTDFTGYGQAWFAMAHGHLDPYVSSWGENFLSDHASFIIIALAPLWWIWPHAVTLLWVQCLALVVGEAVVFTWMCEVATALSGHLGPDGTGPAHAPTDRRARVAGRVATLLPVVGLVLLVANPWIYWSVSFDFHFEVLASAFAVLLAYDTVHLRRRAWLWAVLAALSGDLGITYVMGVGLSAVLAGRAWRRRGVVLIVAPVVAYGLVDMLGLTTGSSVADKYLTTTPNQTPTPGTVGGWRTLLGDLVAHPSTYVARVQHRLVNIYGSVASAGGIGLFCAWGFGVPFVVLVENALANRLQFSETAFQNLPVYLFVSLGTVMVLAWLVRRRVGVAVVLAVLLVASSVGWAVIWGSKTATTWLRVSPAAAHVLNTTLARLPPGDEVVASHSIIGPFAERTLLFEFHYYQEPIDTRHVWFVVSPAQGINTQSVQSDLARVAYLAGPLGAKLVAHGGGVWVFRLTTLPVVKAAVFPQSCATVPAWAVAGSAGRTDVSGPPARWAARSTGAAGYVVSGDYWRLPVGRYVAGVKMRSDGPVSVEVWDADRNVLVARRQLPSTYGDQLVDVPFAAPSELISPGTEGAGIFRMTFPAPPPNDQLEVRVYSPGGTSVSVSSITVVKQTQAGALAGFAKAVC